MCLEQSVLCLSGKWVAQLSVKKAIATPAPAITTGCPGGPVSSLPPKSPSHVCVCAVP